MRVTNQEIAGILRGIAEYLEMQDVPWKPRAYERVAATVEALDEEMADIYKRGGVKAIENIPGVGASIAEKIEELLETGKLKYYEALKKKVPVNLESFEGVEGLGPKSILKLYKELSVKNAQDLERAAKAGKIGTLEGFGKKSEENILKGIEFAKHSRGRFILGFVMPQIREIEARLKRLKEVERLTVAGSVRRMKETVGDCDMLVISDKPKPVMDYFISMPEVARVYAHGETKSAVKLRNGLDVDIRIVPKESYGTALNYFTGSKDHNVALRELALKKGWKLNEYGLFDGKTRIAGKTEEELYKKLGMDYIVPEMRENKGEIALAQKHELPQLVAYGDLRGDLQVQTSWTDGSNSIEEMAEAAAGLGLEYIAITDHTKRLAMTGGLDEKRIQVQWRGIDEANKKIKKKYPKFTILKGTECDILKDGGLDLSDTILSKLDVVGVAVHSHFNLTRKEQTERVKRAITNPHVDILFHPTGRLISRREAYDINMEEIVKAAKRTGTVLEIDALPDRLDLKDDHVRMAVEAGVSLAIDSDAHAAVHYSYLEYGIAEARRGWAEKKDIINTWPLEKMLSKLKK